MNEEEDPIAEDEVLFWDNEPVEPEPETEEPDSDVAPSRGESVTAVVGGVAYDVRVPSGKRYVLSPGASVKMLESDAQHCRGLGLLQGRG